MVAPHPILPKLAALALLTLAVAASPASADDVSVCVPRVSSLGTADGDGDTLPALYGDPSFNVVVHTDVDPAAGSYAATAGTEDGSGSCYLAGDDDDDGTDRVPVSPPAPPTVPSSATVCISWSGNIAPADLDGDGVPALYAYSAEHATVNLDGSIDWEGTTNATCWLAGDADDDGVDHLA
jgi:hypothetical protein